MILLDTNLILAYYNTRDKKHNAAVELMYEIIDTKYGTVYICDYVFDETITYMIKILKNVDDAIKIGHLLLDSFEIIYTGEPEFKRAWEIFKSQKHSSLSFTDCTILSMIATYKIKNIATFDSDFISVKNVNVVGLHH